MNNKFARTCLSLFCIFCFGRSHADPAYTDVKLKYSVQVPVILIPQKIEVTNSPIKQSFLTADKKLSLILMVAESTAKTSVTDFLKSMESSRGLKNKLKPEEMKTTRDVLKSSSASEAVRGQYEFTGKGPNFPVEQNVLVLKKNKFIYALVFAFPKSNESASKSILNEIEGSFKALD